MFNGVYEISNLTVGWSTDEEVYQQKNGNKYIFSLNSSTEDEWGIGSTASLTTGDYDYRGNSSFKLYLDCLYVETWHFTDHLLEHIE